MRISKWYDVNERLPEKSGYYLCFAGPSMFYHSTVVKYLFYNQTFGYWQDNESLESNLGAIFWTDSDPHDWLSTRLHSNKVPADAPAVVAALERVQKAIEEYELIRYLSQ